MSVVVSVIIPVYNCEAYLKRCLDSVSAQTFRDFEVILVNDGSVDTSERICREYTRDDDRFRFVSQENQGQASARNAGIRLARGEWIHFIDADDAVHPQMLEILYASVKSTGASIGMCGFVEDQDVPQSFCEAIEDTRRYTQYHATESGLQNILLYGDKKYWVVWGKLIKKSIVERFPFESGRIYEDNAVICKWFFYAETIVDVNENLYFYYKNTQGTTKSAFSEKQLDRLWAVEEQSKFYRSIGFEHLHRYMDARFVIACASCYRLANTSMLKRKIRKLYYRKILNRGFTIRLNAKERIHVLESFHPLMMQVYWTVSGKILLFLRRK